MTRILGFDLLFQLISLRRLVTDDDSKIVNGATAEANSWPWIGMLFYNLWTINDRRYL